MLNVIFEKTVKIFVLIGVIIAAFSLIYNRSLWLDEAMLARNIVDKSFFQLLLPLDWNQVAPIGFLLVNKSLAGVFGYHDWVFRIFPFLTYLISLPVFYNLVKKITTNNNKALLALLIFSLNHNILYYSNEFKQYSSDILIALLLFSTFYSFYKNDFQNYLKFAFIGAVSIWFSNITILLLFPMAILIFYKNYYVRKSKSVLILYAIWITSFLIYYFLFIYNHPTKDYMLNYWRMSFLPIDNFSNEFLGWFYKRIRVFFGSLIGFGKIWKYTAIFVTVGVIIFIKERKYFQIFIFFFPIIIHLILSGLKMYPFDFRFLLYTIPIIIIFFVEGIYFIWNYLNSKLFKITILVLLVPALIVSSPIISEIPFQNEEIKESLEYMNAHIKNDDKIYVYYGAYDAFVFYQNKYENLTSKEIISGLRHYNEWPLYYSDILEHHGNIWLLFAHVSPFGTDKNEENFIIEKLKTANFKFSNEKKFYGSSIYKVKLEKEN